MNKDCLIIFLKNRSDSNIKTRLQRDIGRKETLELYERLVNQTLVTAGKSNADIHLFYSSSAEKQFEDMVSGIHAQTSSEDLGLKMKQAMIMMFRNGYERVVIIGTDCPYIQPVHLSKAFASLETSDVVLGPAMDGGFYLLGVKNEYYLDFKGITWSTPEVLTKYSHNLEELKASVSHLDTLEDIDEVESYKRYLA